MTEGTGRDQGGGTGTRGVAKYEKEFSVTPPLRVDLPVPSVTSYESKGRQYVVFMSPPVGPGAVGGAAGGGTGSVPETPTGPRGYIAFALPKK